jgi:hypothetical protein
MIAQNYTSVNNELMLSAVENVSALIEKFNYLNNKIK